MSYASTNYCLCKHWNMLQVLILLILFSDFYMFQAISTRAAIISSWKLYVVTFHLWYSIKCLLHLLIIVYVNIELCCKCWYCWFFFLTYTDPRPFRRRTPSSPVENCMYLPPIKCLMHLLTIVYVNIEICCKCWYCWFFFLTFTCSRPFRRGKPSSPVENCMVFTFHLWYSIKCPMHLLTIFYVNIELCCKCWHCWFFFLTYKAGSRPFRRGTPSSPVENCMVFTFHLWYSIKCLMHLLTIFM